jgi:hypothetical protein
MALLSIILETDTIKKLIRQLLRDFILHQTMKKQT